MNGACRWTISGLLCLCGVCGCAQLPSPGLTVRRDRPPADELQIEQRINRSDDGTHDELTVPEMDQESLVELFLDRDRVANRNIEHPETDVPPIIGSAPFSESKDSRIGTSNLNSPDATMLKVEAPSPRQRSLSTPAPFVAPSDGRTIAANSTPNNKIYANRDSVTFASHEDTDFNNGSSVELIAEQRKTNSYDTPNLWDRLRGLTNRIDPKTSGLPGAPDSAVPGELPHLEGIAPNNTINEAVPTMTSPEPWPRSPGTWDSEPQRLAGSTPVNAPWTSFEQLGSSNVPPAAVNPSSFAPTQFVSGNFGSPEGIPISTGALAPTPEFERLITQTTVEAASVNPGENDFSRQLYLRKQVQLRLLYLMAGQTDRAIQPIPGIDPADQEFWQQLTWGMANYFDTQGMPDAAERATQTINQLRVASARLQEKARLELHNVAFCHKISGFGNYHRFKRDEFTPGQPVLLYAEVADFKSELMPDGQFRTLMKSTLEVIEGGLTGRLIESFPFIPSEDFCRNRRRDYYHSYEFTIPQGCNPGPHILRLRVEDQLGKKSTMTTLNFMVQ